MGAHCSFRGKFQKRGNQASRTLVVLLTWIKLIYWCQVSMSCVSCAWTRFRNSFTLGMAFSTAALRLNFFQWSRKSEMFGMLFFDAYKDMRWHASDYILQNLLTYCLVLQILVYLVDFLLTWLNHASRSLNEVCPITREVSTLKKNRLTTSHNWSNPLTSFGQSPPFPRTWPRNLPLLHMVCLPCAVGTLLPLLLAHCCCWVNSAEVGGVHVYPTNPKQTQWTHGISRFQTPTHRPNLRYIQITIKSIALDATSTQHSIVLSKLCAHEIKWDEMGVPKGSGRLGKSNRWAHPPTTDWPIFR